MCETEKVKTLVDADLLTLEVIGKRVMVIAWQVLLGLAFISSAGKGQADVELQ